MELRELRLLVAVADTGSFTAAGRACAVSQQAVSQVVARLERRGGRLLVERLPRGTRLTPAGEETVALARDLLSRAEGLPGARPLPRAAARQAALRVGVLLDGLGPRTGEVVQTLRRAEPDADVQVAQMGFVAVVPALLSGRVQAVLGHGPAPEHPGLDTWTVGSVSRAAVVSVEDPLADAPAAPLEDLLERPLGRPGAGTPEAFERFFTLADERGEEAERVGPAAASFEDVLWAVATHRAVLTVPAHQATTFPGARFAVRHLPTLGLADVPLHVVTRRQPGPGGAAVLDVARAVLSGSGLSPRG